MSNKTNKATFVTTKDEGSSYNPDEGDYPTNPDTLNYDYNTANYKEPRPFDSNYMKTNYDITNFPKTDYTKFNSNETNYNPINSEASNYDTNASYDVIEKNYASVNSPEVMCQSPNMLYQVPRTYQFMEPTKYVCFNNQSKLLEISKINEVWTGNDLSNSNKYIKWQGAQCKITTDKCTNSKLTEDCEATCYINPNDIVQLKYKNNIWRTPELDENAGSCSMSTISEQTANKTFCKCDNILERPYLKTKAMNDKDHSGKFWCDNKQ